MYEAALARGVLAAINEVELMTVFGGYEQLQNAPHTAVVRAMLVLTGRLEAEQERAEEARAAAASASVSSAYR